MFPYIKMRWNCPLQMVISSSELETVRWWQTLNIIWFQSSTRTQPVAIHWRKTMPNIEVHGLCTSFKSSFSLTFLFLLKVAIFPNDYFCFISSSAWFILVVSSASSGPCCAVTMTPTARAGKYVQKRSIRGVPKTLWLNLSSLCSTYSFSPHCMWDTFMWWQLVGFLFILSLSSTEYKKSMIFVGALVPIGLQAISKYHANWTMVMVSYESYHIYKYYIYHVAVFTQTMLYRSKEIGHPFVSSSLVRLYYRNSDSAIPR